MWKLKLSQTRKFKPYPVAIRDVVSGAGMVYPSIRGRWGQTNSCMGIRNKEKRSMAVGAKPGTSRTAINTMIEIADTVSQKL